MNPMSLEGALAWIAEANRGASKVIQSSSEFRRERDPIVTDVRGYRVLGWSYQSRLSRFRHIEVWVAIIEQPGRR